MQRIVELALELPLKLRMIQIAGMHLELVVMRGNVGGPTGLNEHRDPVRFRRRRKGKPRVLVKLQLPAHTFQPRILIVVHGAIVPILPAQKRFLFCLRLLFCVHLSPAARVLYTNSLSPDAQSPQLNGWIDQLRSGDPRALARAISMVENRVEGWSPLLKALFPHTGKARMIGLTGAPGAGKSTLVDQLAKHYRRDHNTLGIIAVDPTSPYSGGAILGDRIRMQDHHADPGIYIRSMATRGSLGGLARTTADVATVLDASGRDLILIETVGVGQDEVDIVRLADITIVILVPGMGDDVQTIKAGIMEIADIFVINKSDREGAERVEREIRAMQSLAVRKDGWTPPIVKTVASEGKGITELAAAIADYDAYLHKQHLLERRTIENWRQRLIEMLRDAMLEKARTHLNNGQVERYAAEIAEHKRDPYTLVEEIVGKAGN